MSLPLCVSFLNVLSVPVAYGGAYLLLDQMEPLMYSMVRKTPTRIGGV